MGKAALVLCLVLLLYLLSSTADEFFCPVLQAIVEKYRIPPHVAGVTFLSFGNGSPDVFSNIAAFATPTPSIRSPPSSAVDFSSLQVEWQGRTG